MGITLNNAYKYNMDRMALKEPNANVTTHHMRTIIFVCVCLRNLNDIAMVIYPRDSLHERKHHHVKVSEWQPEDHHKP